MSTENQPAGKATPRAKRLGTDAKPGPRWWRRPVLWVLLLVGLPVGLIGGHAVLWYLACAQITAQLTVELRNLARQGWSTFADAPVRSGYPWVAEVTVPGLRAAGPLVAWETERLVIRLGLIQPTTVLMAAEGRQTVNLPGATVAHFTATRTEAVVNLAAPDTVNLEIDGLVTDGAAGSAMTIASLRVALDRVGAVLKADARDLVLPSAATLPLGANIRRVMLDLALPAGAPTEMTAQALSAWRDSNGRLEISQALVDWDTVKFIGQAKVALDAKLQLDLTGKLQLGGYAALLDALVKAGKLPARPAQALGAVLGLLARPSDATGPDSVDVPFTIRDRSFAVGRIPLLRMPEMTWPLGK